MPNWILNFVLKIGESLLPHLLALLENKYPGIAIIVNEIKKILGGDQATLSTPSDLVDHLRKF